MKKGELILLIVLVLVLVVLLNINRFIPNEVIARRIIGGDVTSTFTIGYKPPELQRPIELKKAYVDMDYRENIDAYDSDLPNDDLIFYNNESWLFTEFFARIDYVGKYATAVIQFTPTREQEGNYSLNISVVDNYDLIDSEIVPFEVILNNTAPNITKHFPEELDIEVTQNALIKFNISKEDYDMQKLITQWFLDDVLLTLSFSDYEPIEGLYPEDVYDYVATDLGEHNFTVFVIDPYEFFDSKTWLINVKSGGGGDPGGGGGGGGGGSCRPRWNCTEWSPCQLPGVQYRTCIDEANCRIAFDKPEEKRNCTFIFTPSCYDGIQNQGELEIDCGGPCNACPTCYDGIQNQGEEGTDCGGPCPRKCGALYTLYPLCGDGVCRGTDILFCWQDCKQTYYIIGLAALLLAIYLMYGSKKLMESIKKAIKESKKKLVVKEKKAPALVVINELNKIEKALTEKNIGRLFISYSKLIKEFFAVFYLIKYEFTISELSGELKKRGVDQESIKKIINVFDVIDSVEYGKYKISYEAFVNLIGLSRLTIQNIVQTKEVIKKEGFMDKIIRKIKGEKKLKISEALVLLKTKIKEKNKLEAANYYKKVKNIYDRLSAKEKKLYYDEMMKLYNQFKKIKE